MKKADTDIRDIYRAEDPAPETGPANQLSEQLAWELRKQRIFNLFAGLLGFALLVSLAVALVLDYRPKPEKVVSIGIKTPFIAAYTLPMEEQWVVEYREVAFQADNSELRGPKPLSSKWVKNAAYHIIMGEQALRLDDAGVAQDHFEAVINAFPAMTGIRRYLGEVYLKKQFFEKAAEQLQKALEEGRSADVLNNLGIAYIAIGKYDLAEGLLKEALLEKPDCAGFYKNFAQLYQKAGNSNEAVAAFEKYLSLNPQDTRQLENYVAYLTAAGRPRDAVAFLDRVEGADLLTISLLQARAAAQDNDAERAVQSLRKAARFRTPSQTIEEMHDPVFDKIAKTEPFEALIYQLEMAAVSFATNLNASGGDGH